MLAALPSPLRLTVGLLLLCGVAGSAILAVGLVGIVYSEARMTRPAVTPHLIVGVYRYNSDIGGPVGAPGSRFSSDDDLVGTLEWQGLDPSTVISAEWYDTSGDLIDSIGPAPVRSLASDAVMWASDNTGAGEYVLAVVRWDGDARAETMARWLVDLS